MRQRLFSALTNGCVGVFRFAASISLDNGPYGLEEARQPLP
jgi:hypothetical protein